MLSYNTSIRACNSPIHILFILNLSPFNILSRLVTHTCSVFWNVWYFTGSCTIFSFDYHFWQLQAKLEIACWICSIPSLRKNSLINRKSKGEIYICFKGFIFAISVNIKYFNLLHLQVLVHTFLQENNLKNKTPLFYSVEIVFSTIIHPLNSACFWALIQLASLLLLFYILLSTIKVD